MKAKLLSCYHPTTTHVPVSQQLTSRLSISDFFKLIRFKNLAIMAFTQYLVWLFLIGEKGDWLLKIQDPGILLLSIATITIGAAGYIINDYYDIKIDTINKPDRVVIGRSLSRRMAMVLHMGLSGIGIAIGYYLHPKVLLGCFVAVFWLWLYSNQLKRMPFWGNLSVALLTVMAIEGVNAYFDVSNLLVHMFAIFAFFISVIREIIKDMEDLRGDMHFDCRTLPIVWGIRKTKVFIFIVLGVFALITIGMLIPIANIVLTIYFILMLPLIGYFVHKLYWADTKKAYHRLSSACKWFMLTGIIVMIFA